MENEKGRVNIKKQKRNVKYFISENISIITLFIVINLNEILYLKRKLLFIYVLVDANQ